MIPIPYKMVDLDGLDLSEIHGEVVEGIYNKVRAAFQSSRMAIFCNWLFADIVIAPSYVLISEPHEGEFLVNDAILVKSDDTIQILGIVPSPVIQELNATENREYLVPEGVDGFSPVNVNVPIPQPVMTELTAINNGIYTPPTGVDGYSSVNVNLPNPNIVASYQGLSYSYVSAGSWMRSTSKTAYINLFEVVSGRYAMFQDYPNGNVYRCAFYAGKSLSDFTASINNPSSGGGAIYNGTNIYNGSSGNTLTQRTVYTADSSGVIIVQTSNSSQEIEAYLMKLTD